MLITSPGYSGEGVGGSQHQHCAMAMPRQLHTHTLMPCAPHNGMAVVARSGSAVQPGGAVFLGGVTRHSSFALVNSVGSPYSMLHFSG